MLRTVTTPPSEPVRADGTKAGGWWHDDEGSGRIVCDLCPRGCTLKPGDRGFCFVRENRAGQMVLATYGRSTGFCIDPIEKEAAEPLLSWDERLVVWHGGLQPGLQVLPELVDVQVA